PKCHGRCGLYRLCANSSRARGLRLRRQPLRHPGLPVSAVSNSGVQPILSMLPELERFGDEAVAAPMLWPRDLPGVLRVEFPEGRLELLARRNWLALLRDRGGDLASAGARRPIRVRLRFRQLLDSALDADLPAGHVEQHRRARI